MGKLHLPPFKKFVVSSWICVVQITIGDMPWHLLLQGKRPQWPYNMSLCHPSRMAELALPADYSVVLLVLPSHCFFLFMLRSRQGRALQIPPGAPNPRGLSPRAWLAGLPWPAPSVVHKPDPWVLLQRRRHNFWNIIQIPKFLTMYMRGDHKGSALPLHYT